MTSRDLSNEWARAHVEACADGSLSKDSRARMDAALAADPALRAAAERAVAVRCALRESGAAPLPAGLRARLLAIPGRSQPAWRSWAVAAAAVAVAVVAVALWVRPTVAPSPDPRVVAVQEFELAMRYVQKSARITRDEVTSAVGTGLRDAFAASREALERDTDETGG
jgi:anti-sigma factor RsiW